MAEQRMMVTEARIPDALKRGYRVSYMVNDKTRDGKTVRRAVMVKR